MRTLLLLAFFGASGLLTAACSNDAKTTTETTTTTVDSTSTNRTIAVDTLRYYNDLDALADRIVADLKLSDTVVVRKVRTVYRKRAHRLAATETRYTTDTTGRYAALRAANDEADVEMKSAIDAQRYAVYQQNRPAYYQGTPFTVVVVAEGSGPAVVKKEVEKDGDVKVKYADGTKVKIGEDGDRKIKNPDGTKVKNGDDGLKVKK